MRVLIAPDKFKGSLSSQKICTIIEKSLKDNFNGNNSIFTHPMADGGDGSLTVLSKFIPFEIIELEVKDPVGQLNTAYYCAHEDTAYIELAIASGISKVSEGNRNPRYTSTYGTGQLMKHAIECGYKKIMLFLGGSSTNDAGIGIAAALGFSFLDAGHRAVEPVGNNLAEIQNIQFDGSIDFKTISIQILCDVNNPLFGTQGAAFTFARQKGASDDDIIFLDKGLENIASQFYKYSGVDVQNIPGSGAAGGIGAGLSALCNAELISGFDVLSRITQLEHAVANADIIISGEGRIDDTSFEGKVVGGIFALTEKHDKKLILVCGGYDKDAKFLMDKGLAIYDLMSHTHSVEEAISNAEELLTRCCVALGDDLKESQNT